MQKMFKQFMILGKFIGHLLMGGAMFAALLIFGGALNMLVQWAGPIIGDDSFVYLMKLVERCILYLDIIFIIWWAVYSTFYAIKEMMKEMHDE